MRGTGCSGRNYIPKDILIDILVRLPAKSLVRFMCVCKSWTDLIRSSTFIATHLNRNVTKHAHTFLVALHYASDKRRICRSLFSNETFKLCFQIEHPLRTETCFHVYGSSNGLLCLSDEDLHLNSPICIYNPSIRKHVVLPMTNILSEPLSSGHDISLAFGFHLGLNDYKVVRMVSFAWEKHSSELEVYTLSTNSWKKLDAIPPLVKTMQWDSGYEISNGVAYWTMFSKNDPTLYLVSFDTSSEAFEVLPLPEGINYGIESIEAYKGSICLLQHNMGEQEEHIDMWILQEKSFKKFHSVVIPGMSVNPMGLGVNNEILMECHKKNSGGSDLGLYELEHRQVNETGIRLVKKFYDGYFAITYVESLVLLMD